MKNKIALNKISYSIIETQMQAAPCHRIISNIKIKIKESEENSTNLTTIVKFNTENNLYKIKVPTGISTYSKNIKILYKNKLIGPILLECYSNKKTIASNIEKSRSKAPWFIKIENFFIEMPEESLLLWQYQEKNKRVFLNKGTLISLYVLPLAQFIKYYSIIIEKN